MSLVSRSFGSYARRVPRTNAPYVAPLLARSRLPIPSHRPLSTRVPRLNRQHAAVPQPKSGKAEPKKPVEDAPEIPALSLDSLGLGKNMKIFLLVLLGIFGSMETYFYCRAIWRWWSKSSNETLGEEEK